MTVVDTMSPTVGKETVTMPLQPTGAPSRPPKKKTKATPASTRALTGAAEEVATGVRAAGGAVVETVTGKPATFPSDEPNPEPKPEPKVPKPPKEQAGGGNTTPTREGRWVQGAVGKWKLGAEGQWVQDGRSEFKETYSGNIGRGGGGRAGGGNRLVGSEGTIRNFDGTTYRAGSSNTTTDVTPGGGGAGGGGAGGTGSPLAAAGSAIKALGLTSTKFEGRSVEEVTARGAKKTRRVRARRAE